MPSISDIQRQIDQVDRLIVELLSRRMALIKQVYRQMDDDEQDTDRQAQVLSNWLEEGFDYDLDEASMEKICKAVMEMGRKGRES